MSEALRVRIHPALPTDLRRTLGPIARGPRDPAMRFLPDGRVVRATWTPQGPATVELRPAGGDLEVTSWGPGAAWALERAPDLCGARDSLAGFDPRPGVVAELHRRMPGLRLCRTGRVVDALVVAILEQKVTGHEAVRTWTRLVRALGDPAPGPHAGLTAGPRPDRLAAAPYWDYHLAGVEQRRARLLRLAGTRAAWLEACVDLPSETVQARLLSLPGVGPWTAAQVRLAALGDPDAVSVGDYNLPNLVSWALAGERHGTDERMLELLEPYRGHRGRVLRLLVAGHAGPPRHGPRMPARDIARL